VSGAWVGVLSAVWWTISAAHFFPGALLLTLAARFASPRRLDPFVRVFVRNVVRLAGARLRVVRDPAFDERRVAFFVSNHVNIFDPFVVHSAIPQFTRGLELESHFDVPVYGWLMRAVGNVAVPDRTTPSSVRTLHARCRAAIEGGMSLIVFAEGTRTRSGAVGPFRPGAFRMAREFRVPVVPVSVVGAYEWKRVGDWRLRSSVITVHVHAPVEVREEDDPREVAERVRAIVARPVDDARQRAG